MIPNIAASASSSQAASNSSPINIGGNTGAGAVVWIVLGIVALLGAVLFLKLRK